MSNVNNTAGVTEKNVMSRKQFLSVIGIAAVGFILPSMLFSSKKLTYVNGSYGNNSYGGKV